MLKNNGFHNRHSPFNPGASLALNFLSGTLPSTVTFTRSSTATYFTSTGALATAAINEPRFDYNPATLALRGLLIEEQRTNSIRNNTAVGAVAGTPGTLPTNWGSVTAGLTQTIVGTGVENGITYIDIRLNGTTTGTSAGIRFETSTGIAATSGQTWAASTFCRLVSGSTANVATLNLGISGLTAGGTGTTDSGTVSLLSVVNMNNLATTRLSRGFTFADATTAYARVQVIVSFLVGAAINITLRIGLPQLELGAFATSVIPTTGAAATRAPDVATMVGANFSNWYNQSEGTLNVQYVMEGVKSVSSQRIAQIDDGTETNRIVLLLASGNAPQAATAIASGNTGSVLINTPVVAGTLNKQAVAYQLNNFNLGYNGAVGTTDTSVDIPTGLSALRFASPSSGGAISNMWFQRITYYPRRLSNAELQVITS